MPSTIDVARLAGVPHQTVSRAFIRPETVRPEIRERITSAIERVGYRRSLAARALVTNQTGNLGLVDSGSSIPGHASVPIEGAARERDYATTVAVLANPAKDVIAAAFSHLMDRRVQGIIVLANTTDLAERRSGSPLTSRLSWSLAASRRASSCASSGSVRRTARRWPRIT